MILRVDFTPDGQWRILAHEAAPADVPAPGYIPVWQHVEAVVLTPAAAAWLKRGQRPAACAWCGWAFVPTRRGHRYCGRACQRRGREDG